MSLEKAEAFVARGRSVIALAWEIGGEPGLDTGQALQATQNGLLAIAIVEIMARPYLGVGVLGSSVAIRDILKDD